MSTSSGSRATADMPDAALPDAAADDRLLPSASTTGIWISGEDLVPAESPEETTGPRFRLTRTPEVREKASPSRQAASTGFGILAEALPPLPLIARVSGGRLGADAIARALGLLVDLHVDRASYGWRLTPRSSRDERHETSELGEVIDAMAEYGNGHSGAVLVSLPGPWTLVTALSTGLGSPVLADHGARRDVVQAYAFGMAELADRLRRTGLDPVFRLVESRLEAILTGSWPTVSGFGSLPAVPEAQVYGALASTLRHLPPTILALPNLRPLQLRGKEIPAAEVVSSIGAEAASVPLAGLRPRGWEQLAILAEAGRGTWLHLPVTAGLEPDRVSRWHEAIASPWARIGMSPRTLGDIGVIAGPELPLGHPPFLGVDDLHGRHGLEKYDRGTMTVAADVRRALEESE